MLEFYHITLTENVASLLSKGADSSLIGVNSMEAGPGFHLTSTYAWAQEWACDLFYHPSPPGPQTAILRVCLPDIAQFATDREKPSSDVLERWGKAQGYLKKDGSPKKKLLKVAHEENWTMDSDYFPVAMESGVYCALIGEYLMGRGFDGYWVDNSLVVTNFALLAPDAFAIATGIHQQMVTLQDTATGRFLTLKLSPQANDLQVDCYLGAQPNDGLIASFQVVSEEGQVKLLYWRAVRPAKEEPECAVLADFLNGSSPSKGSSGP